MDNSDKIERYLPKMTGKYKRKHYGQGVFARIHKNTAKVSVLVYLFFGAVLAGCGYGMWWCIRRSMEIQRTGGEDAEIGYIMAAVLGVFALIALACLIISAVRHARGPERWKAVCAKENGYTVEDMNDFERQALDMDSRVISLVGVVAKATAGQEDGILTRDYIALRLEDKNIFKLADLTVACLVEQNLKVGAVRTAYLTVGLQSRTGGGVVAECTKESGPVLIAYLKERCPDIYTGDGKILSRNEYLQLRGEGQKKTNA